jgi:ribosomal protein S12 methylthiotransferase accessory factor
MWREIVHRVEGPGRIVAEIGPVAIGTDHPGDQDRAGRDPEPWLLFLASIGTCAASFAAAAARERGIDPATLRIVQRQDFRDDGTNALDMEIEIRCESALGEADRAALVAAAGRCTVKRAIEDGTTIRIS